VESKNQPPAGVTSTCFNCNKPCTMEHYCYGCRHFVCDTCSINFTMGRGHTQEDHLREEEE
jgi:hypothetical protein